MPLELRGKQHARGFETGSCIPDTDLSSSAALKRVSLMAKLLPLWPFVGWHLLPFPSFTLNCLDWPPLAEEWVYYVAEQGEAGGWFTSVQFHECLYLMQRGAALPLK